MKVKLLTSLLLLSAQPIVGYAVPTDSMAIGLSEAVVTANRWQQALSEQPKHIALVTPKEVGFHNPQTTADLLGLSGEVFIQKSQLGGGSPMIRGFATNRLLYVVDGVRMNTAIFRSGNIQNVISLDPFALQTSEVVFGPGSVIYGSDAMGGVMNFRTKETRYTTTDALLVTGSVTARYASANKERTAHVDVGVGGRRWAMLTSISAFDFGDLRQGKHGPADYLKPYLVERINGQDVVRDNPNPLVQSPSGYAQLNLMQKLRFAPTEAWDLQYALHYSTTSEYARYDRHTRLRRGRPRYGEWSYGPQRWMLNLLTATHQAQGSFYDQMALRAGIQRFEESRIDRAIDKTERTTTEEKVDAYSLNLDFTKALTPRATLYYGAEYVQNRVASYGLLTDVATGRDTATASRYPQSRWESGALYAQALYRLGGKVNVEAGLRYNYYRLKADFSNHGIALSFAPQQSISKGALSGSVGFTYRPTAQWLLSASVSRGFRTPNVDDMGKLYDAVDGAVTVPNPSLSAEYADNIELGIARRFGQVLHLDFSAYYTHVDNALVRRNYHFNGQDSLLYKGEMHKVLAIQNAASAYVYGFHVGLRATLPWGFGLRANVNYQHGKEEVDNGTRTPLRHAAPLFGQAILSYEREQWRAALALHFQGRRLHEDMPEDERDKKEIYALDANGNAWSPAWCTLDLKVQYQATKQLSFSGALENLTDKRYRTYSSGISGAGRNAILSATYTF